MSDVGAKRYAVLEKQLQSSIQRFIDVMQEHDDVPEDVLGLCDAEVHELLTSMVMCNKRPHGLSSVKSSISEAGSNVVTSEISGMLDDITMQNFNESSIDSEPLAKKWKELRQFEERVDDDLVVDRARTKVSDRCPITLVPFTDPVKSKKCGHTYEREAILKVLSSVQKCPVCQKKLTANQLVDDLELFQKIQNQKRIAMRAKKSGFISSSCNSRTMDLTQSN